MLLRFRDGFCDGRAVGVNEKHTQSRRRRSPRRHMKPHFYATATFQLGFFVYREHPSGGTKCTTCFQRNITGRSL